MNKYAEFYGLCRLAEITEQERFGAIRSVSNQRTESIKELGIKEYDNLVKWAKDVERIKNKGMRGKITYYLIQCGYVLNDGFPDWVAINKYVAEHGGKANPKNKELKKLTTSQLRGVLLVVQQFYKTKFSKELKQAEQ